MTKIQKFEKSIPGLSFMKEIRKGDLYIEGIEWNTRKELFIKFYRDKLISVWNTSTGKITQEPNIQSNIMSNIRHVSKSPNGMFFASINSMSEISIINPKTFQNEKRINLQSEELLCLAWNPQSTLLAVGSLDRTVQIIDIQAGRVASVLEGHIAPITDVSFSHDGNLFVSSSTDGVLQFWNTQSWENVLIAECAVRKYPGNFVKFNPFSPILALIEKNQRSVSIWKVNYDLLLSGALADSTIHYSNAKVVLVGDSGVGKSGLGLVLTGRNFSPTESTHGRHVWKFDSEIVKLPGDREASREILLWDLAGQPGYRLIHQLHLDEVAVALVVFDGKSETDPFSGVRHWEKALKQAQNLQGSDAIPLVKYLVSARADRGGIGISKERIEEYLNTHGYSGYFETSAKEDWHIEELRQSIKNAIDWEKLPKVSSNELFQQIKQFLISEKETGHLLSTTDDLFFSFLKEFNISENKSKLKHQFETCIGRVESRGLIRRLKFGDLVLLQPELLDNYSSFIINAAKDEPDGLGSLFEEDILNIKFRIPSSERIRNKEHEKLLIIATISELLAREIAFKESTQDGNLLVFPSQLTRENPDLPIPEGKDSILRFEGAVKNIYSTLAVRLARSGYFIKKQMWKNASEFEYRIDGKSFGICGIYLLQRQEGEGEVTLFFRDIDQDIVKAQFKEFVYSHLNKRSIPDSVEYQKLFRCENCLTDITYDQYKKRIERGFDWITCSVCDTVISLIEEKVITNEILEVAGEMNKLAEKARKSEESSATLHGKIQTEDFDVFLCYNSEDKSEVIKIGNKLKEVGILPWLDEWELRPGYPWQRLLEEKIENIKSVAVFIGKNGIGPWQRQEIEAFLREFVQRETPIIPVILPNSQGQPSLPVFLRGMTWVDFRLEEPDPMIRLSWGITGEKSPN